MLTIELPWPDRDLSPNARVHHMALYRAKKAAKNYAWAKTASAMGERKIVKGSWRGPIICDMVFHPKSAAQDDDNATAMCKAYRDGIASALGVDDNLFRLKSHMAEPKKGGLVIFTLSPAAVEIPMRGTIK